MPGSSPPATFRTLAETAGLLAVQAPAIQADLDRDHFATLRAIGASASAQGAHPFAQALRTRLAPRRQVLSTWCVDLRAAIEARTTTATKLVVRPLNLGHEALFGSAAGATLHLTLDLIQEPPVPPTRA